MLEDIYRYEFALKIGDNHRALPIFIISSIDIEQVHHRYSEYTMAEHGTRIISPPPAYIRNVISNRIIDNLPPKE